MRHEALCGTLQHFKWGFWHSNHKKKLHLSIPRFSSFRLTSSPDLEFPLCCPTYSCPGDATWSPPDPHLIPTWDSPTTHLTPTWYHPTHALQTMRRRAHEGPQDGRRPGIRWKIKWRNAAVCHHNFNNLNVFIDIYVKVKIVLPHIEIYIHHYLL